MATHDGNALTRRAHEAAHELLRDAEPDPEIVAKAYAHGFVAGLDHAADCVRIEAEATKSEL